MTAVLDELELTELVTSITGISPVGAAAIHGLEPAVGLIDVRHVAVV